ncbi:MAG: aspartate--tRNA ligase [Candidatus Absconditabacteria bacterium]|nr:aspartate--tRNA ligase [Candidatus Absconditabacteria bacterium]
MYRTHTCGQLTGKNIDENVILSGWINKVRNLGGMTFIDLRDRYGITQVTYDPSRHNFPLPEIKSEYVVQISGTVVSRPDSMINKDMTTGEIEISPTEIKVLSTCKELPFPIDHEAPVGEDIRLEYRYLDLRRETMKQNMIVRHKIYTETIKFFDQENFLHIETPAFVKNTPEGSREFIVPARFEPGKFFVLPQSPQQQKQMLMVAGMDKYVQIARCFRDEDPRGDRQPEFTQVDFEMSFVEQQDVLDIIERYYLYITKTIFPQKKITQEPFPIYTWYEMMDKYGSDKPELRTAEFGFQELSDRGKTLDFGLFQQSSSIKAILLPKSLSRSEADKYEGFLKQYGSKGLAWLSMTSEGLKGSISKFITPEALEKLPNKLQGDWTLLFQVGEWEDVTKYLGMLRTKLIQDLESLKDKENEVSFAHIVDFPLFETGSDGSLGAVHHPFTKPKDEDIPFVKALGKKMSEGGVMTEEDKQKLLSIKADCFDIIFNGSEAGGGSIRIHDRELQHAIFAILGLSEKQIQERFGHMLKSFEYGVPPHGGCAFGLDRTVMLYQNMENIREVIAFPKNQKYRDLMIDAPGEIDENLLSELGLSVIKKE